ncbi:Septum site-determining protein MinC [Buchnera aphidicola (Thelaxes suberi)]|uniref:septum site-determining protein MinC n=1 Tax=Buchnera aphidicola TaxID=9 RepID=UPI0034638BA3
MNNKIIEFKGQNFTLLVLCIYSENTELVNIELKKKIKKFPYFFNSSAVVLNVNYLSHTVNWLKIKKILQSFQLKIIGFLGSTDDNLTKKIINSGIPIFSEINKLKKYYQNNFFSFYNEKKKTDFYHLNNTTDNIKIKKKQCIINTPIRSGQKIYAPDSDLVIINNVSAGAEIVSNGNVHIYGALRGRVLAGADGNQNCQIFCTKIFAELVSIAGEYWLMDKIPLELIGKGVRFFLNSKILNIAKLH